MANVNMPCRLACFGAREMGLAAGTNRGVEGYVRCVPERTDTLTARERFTWAFLDDHDDGMGAQ
jgi:hypothetical protein